LARQLLHIACHAENIGPIADSRVVPPDWAA
jgi:hypothetical protein